jgi:phosphatidylinositol-3-phosphatase
MALLALGAAACGSARTATASTTAPTSTTKPATPPLAPATTTATPAAARHIMIVMMENHGYSEIIGQSDQPYTNSLAAEGLATNSYAFGHPSLPNYLVMVSGSNHGVTVDQSSSSFPAAKTIGDQLLAAGYTAKAYAEQLSTVDSDHFPWTRYFPNGKTTTADATALISDLNSASAPDFVWYTPNLINDEHNGTVEDGDAFLSRLIPEVQSTAWYRSGGEIIVEWDESDGDNAGINGSGGGHVPTIVVSAALKAAPQQDSSPVNAAGILRSIEDAYGLSFLGMAGDPANGNIDALLKATPVPAPAP